MTTYDCNEYKNCPKELTGNFIDYTNKDILKFLFVGCWGVYCKTGEQETLKFKKEKIKKNTDNYGGRDTSDAMIEFTKDNKVDAVLLAGDNVYNDYPDEERKKLILEGKVSNYNIDKQLSLGFEKCMANVNTERFLIGVGNHDIETCYVLNQQLNYRNPKWYMPALSYNIIYNLKDFKVNLIFIDTNMYEDNWCQGKYPENAKEQQFKWLGEVLIKYDKNENKVWNIVIGHIPFIANPHKEVKDVRKEEDLYNLIEKYSSYINLYMCADEHNQQYISIPGMPPQVISGSGGAILDEKIFTKNFIEKYTDFARATFGFVDVNITSDYLKFTFKSTVPSRYGDITYTIL